MSSSSDSSHSLDENLSASNFNLSLDNVIAINGSQSKGIKTPQISHQPKGVGKIIKVETDSSEQDDEEEEEEQFDNEESNSVAEFKYEIDPSSILLQPHSPEPEPTDENGANTSTTNNIHNSDNENENETNYNNYQEENNHSEPHNNHRPKRKKRFKKSSLALSVLTKLKIEQSSYRKALIFYLLKKHLSK